MNGTLLILLAFIVKTPYNQASRYLFLRSVHLSFPSMSEIASQPLYTGTKPKSLASSGIHRGFFKAADTEHIEHNPLGLIG